VSTTGKLYVFEGADGVGKSTLSRRFAEYLAQSGEACEYLTFPGNEGGTLGRHVYALHHDPKACGVDSLSPTSLQLLHLAAHVDTIETHILPLLKSGRSVVLDRYWWSTKVYGLVGGINRRMLDLIIELEHKAWSRVRPAAVFLINRKEPLRPEPHNEWKKWCEGYKLLASEELNKYPIHFVDNDLQIEEAVDSILSIYKQALVRPKSREKQLPLAFNQAKATSPVPYVFSSISPAKPTVVFDTYWYFAAERQSIFFRRLSGEPTPWTNDEILNEYKFTNAYRASDRVSQYLIKHVIYEGEQSPEEVFFRILLFKLFNKIETWELLSKSIGPIRYESYRFNDYDEILTNAIDNHQTIYSAAYIMPSGSRIWGTTRKHRTHLKLLEKMMEDEVAHRISDVHNMYEAFKLLRSYPMIGDFLAYQYVTDINYSNLTDFDEMEFVVPGPGAKDGIQKCFESLGGLNEIDIIKVMADRQQEEFERLGLDFQSLWGRPLQLIDCQNLFCEVDKYARVKHPNILGLSQRTRIKQKFRKHLNPVEYWYPPKWNINERIPQKGGDNGFKRVSK
jgi:thymidylate kinase